MPRGFIDLQNNGWMGTDFTEPGLTVERMKEVTRDLVARGTLGYLPTLITGKPEVYEENFAVIAETMKDPEIGGHILGIHLEGPFISPVPGAVGAHPRACVLDPDPDAFDKFQKWAQGNIRILTLAPEQPNAESLIRHCTEQGVVVSMGHHMATDEQMAAAVQAGATMCTHVGNGIPNEIHRHNNPLWWQLAEDSVNGLFITDGHHLPADLIKVALRAKTPDRFLVISDASPLAGMAPGKYKIFNDLPVVISDDGLIYSEQSQSLAGSHSTLLECMNHLASLDLLDEEGLWQVGYHGPLKAIGLSDRDVADFDGPGVHYEGGRFAIAS